MKERGGTCRFNATESAVHPGSRTCGDSAATTPARGDGRASGAGGRAQAACTGQEASTDSLLVLEGFYSTPLSSCVGEDSMSVWSGVSVC